MFRQDRSALVLLSGGQDSTTCLYWAAQRFPVHTLTMRYGQRHDTEIAAAEKISQMAGCVSHKTLHLSVLKDIYEDSAAKGLPSSFIPGRNMLFLATAASYAARLGVREIVTGVCQADDSDFPDCRRSFIDAMEFATNFALPSSCGPITIHTPLMDLTKTETVYMARALPGCWEALAVSMTCYNGTRCGTCPACRLRAQGFERADLVDPSL